MTRKPPDPLPDPGPVPADGTVIPGADAVEAWHLAYLEHRRQLRRENSRYAAVCAELREMFGPPSGTPHGGRYAAASAANQVPSGELNTAWSPVSSSPPKSAWCQAAAGNVSPCGVPDGGPNISRSSAHTAAYREFSRRS